jgi:preprotein translocase subunit SecE
MATSQVETVSTTADKAKLALALALALGALAGFYLLAKQGPVVQWGGLIGGLVVAVVVFLTSEPGKQFVAFGRDSWREVKKSGLAGPQGSRADDGLRLCIRGGHGTLFVAHR